MRRLASLIAVALTALGLVGTSGIAHAATGDVGYQDQSFSGVSNPPTSDKPQSKLWYTDGAWWADMFDSVSQTWHIYRLDRSTEQWVDTRVRVDDRPNTLADALWDGTHLFVASHVVTVSSDSTTKAAQPGNPARLYRYSYSTTTKTFALDAGFPRAINEYSSESLTIDKDSTGTVWATWTQVSGSTTSGFTNAVFVNSSADGGLTWGTPFVLPVAGANPEPDDISTVVAFDKSRIGVLWSNQIDGTVYWATHNDGAGRTAWRGSVAVRGNKLADDHLNIKAVQADQTGRVFAVVKTSLDGSATKKSSDPQIVVLEFKPGTGSWSSTPFGTLADCHTRPQLLLDEQDQTVHVIATAPTSSGCPYPGAPGTIYEKSAPMDDLVFPPGRGTPIIRDVASENMNNATTTKQSVDSTTGLVVLASNTSTNRYWHADLSLGGGTPPVPTVPVAGFSASVTSGVAPLVVQFADTSTGAPTSWAWGFGDGGTAAVENPSHTFVAAGTYTVSLVASNAAGASGPATVTITVSAPPAGGGTSSGSVSAGAATTAVSDLAVTAVTVPMPAGVVDGDVLVAQINANNSPSMSSAPAGWSPVVSPLSVTTNARVFVYYHVVGDAGSEPASVTWQLSSAQKWGANMASFHGVDPADPFDSLVSTARDTSWMATALTVPGVSGLDAGAMLVGGVGLDSASIAVTAPSGWTEAGQNTGGQISELAWRAQPTAGSSGDATWTTAKVTTLTGWLRALRPAA